MFFPNRDWPSFCPLFLTRPPFTVCSQRLRSVDGSPLQPAQKDSRMSTIPQADPAEIAAAEPLLVRRAAVLGAGTMGSRIAAHLANAGIPVLLLDLPRKRSDRPLASIALEALAKSKPAAFYDQASASLITPGTFENDLPKLAQLRLGHRSRR